MESLQIANNIAAARLNTYGRVMTMIDDRRKYHTDENVIKELNDISHLLRMASDKCEEDHEKELSIGLLSVQNRCESEKMDIVKANEEQDEEDNSVILYDQCDNEDEDEDEEEEDSCVPVLLERSDATVSGRKGKKYLRGFVVKDKEDLQHYDERYEHHYNRTKRNKEPLPAKRSRKKRTIFDPSYNKEQDRLALRHVDILGREDTYLTNSEVEDLKMCLDMLHSSANSPSEKFLKSPWGKKCIGNLLEICANNSGYQTEKNMGPSIICNYVRSILDQNDTQEMITCDSFSGKCSLCNRQRKVDIVLYIEQNEIEEDKYFIGPKCGAMLSALDSLATALVNGLLPEETGEEFWDRILNLQGKVEEKQHQKQHRKKSKY